MCMHSIESHSVWEKKRRSTQIRIVNYFVVYSTKRLPFDFFGLNGHDRMMHEVWYKRCHTPHKPSPMIHCHFAGSYVTHYAQKWTITWENLHQIFITERKKQYSRRRRFHVKISTKLFCFVKKSLFGSLSCIFNLPENFNYTFFWQFFRNSVVNKM